MTTAPHNMKNSFRRDLFDGSQGSDVFVLVPCRRVGCTIFSTLGFLSVRPRADSSVSRNGMTR